MKIIYGIEFYLFLRRKSIKLPPKYIFSEKTAEGFFRVKKVLTKEKKKINVIGITRVRNEEMIIRDTLEHMMAFVDGVVLLDDCSSDRTLSEVFSSDSNVIEVLINPKWNSDRRPMEETIHRNALLNIGKKYNPHWFFCFDADERFEGEIPLALSEYTKSAIDGVRVQLFDAYLTKDDCQSIRKHDALFNLRTYFGIERRDIIMLFRNKKGIRFEGEAAREPTGCTEITTEFYCQHYGKAISVMEWENTCDYYGVHFPEPYKTKWLMRKGRAIHNQSDFDTPLYTWDEVKLMANRIHP